MQISKLTTKGQITIPSVIRKNLGLEGGDQVAFLLKDRTVVLIPVENDIGAAFGLVEAERSVSVEEMEEVIRSRAVERSDRS